MLLRRHVLSGGAAFILAGSAACVAPPAEEPELINTVWQLQEIQYSDGAVLTAEPPDNYTVEFSPDGNLVAQADCNQAVGPFSATDGNEITVGPLASTSAACPPGSISEEFVQGLNDSAIYFFKDGNLFVDIQYDIGTMKFLPASNP